MLAAGCQGHSVCQQEIIRRQMFVTYKTQLSNQKINVTSAAAYTKTDGNITAHCRNLFSNIVTSTSIGVVIDTAAALQRTSFQTFRVADYDQNYSRDMSETQHQNGFLHTTIARNYCP